MTPDPVQYPTVHIGDKDYTVKFRAKDVIDLKQKYNIDLMSGEGMTFRGIEALQMCANVLSIGIAHEAAISPEKILEAADIEDFGALLVAVQASQKKALDRSMSTIKAAQDAGTIFKPATAPAMPMEPVKPEVVQ